MFQENGMMKTAAVYGALATAACIYGGWALVAKIALQDGADPMVFAFYRCLGGSIVLFSAMSLSPSLACSKGSDMIQKVQSIPRSDVQRFVMIGAFMAANIAGFILAASKLSALTCSVFQPSIPIFAMIFSVIFGVEQISKHKGAGISCMIAGAMCVAAFGETAATGGTTDPMTNFLGICCLLVNVNSTALYMVHNKDVVRTYEPVFATAMVYLAAAAIMFVVALVSAGFNIDSWMLGGSSKAWLGLVYATALTTAVNYSLLAWVNKQSSPIITSCSSTLQPIAAATLSLIFLGIGFSVGQFIGATFIIAGLVIMLRGQVQETEAQEKEGLLEREKGLA